VTTTEDHPYWNSTDQQWQQAQELDPGDILLAANGRTVRASGLRADTVRTAMAFTLSVDDLHTYYVLGGDAPVLVHNCPASKALNSAEQASVAWSDR
jgi:pretoxin HINT domain-containing protein